MVFVRSLSAYVGTANESSFYSIPSFVNLVICSCKRSLVFFLRVSENFGTVTHRSNHERDQCTGTVLLCLKTCRFIRTVGYTRGGFKLNINRVPQKQWIL